MLLSVQTAGLVDRLGPEAGFRLIRACGFEAIDWNIDRGWDRAAVTAGRLEGSIFEQSDEAVLAFFADELAEIRKNGLVITQAHAPFPSHVRGVPGFREYAVDIYRSCIRLCHAVGCRHLVIHGISCRYNEPEMTAGDMWEKNMALFGELIPTLLETDVTICLESPFASTPLVTEGVCSDPRDAVAMIDGLNAAAGRECFGLCLDTGHLNLLRKNVVNYIRILGTRIKALHIHDNNGVDDQHMMPFTGCFRWQEFLSTLREVGYKGDLSFETWAQIRAERLPKEFIPVFLRAISGVGGIFRASILGER